MKLTYFQLEPHLAKNLASLYIVSGDELFLKQEAISLIRKAGKLAGFTERTRLTPVAGFDWDSLYTLLHARSLLAEKQIIELDFRDITPNKTASQILQDYAKNLSNDQLVIIDLSKVDDKIAKSAWYKALEKVGMVVTIWPLPREQLPGWILQRTKKYKLQMSADAANLLADFVEGNLIAAAQTIEKIYLLKPEGVVDIDLIKAILTDESRFTIFDFIEHIIGKDIARTLHILESLKADGTEPTLILWGITRELRLLADLAEQRKRGETFETLFQKHRIFSRRQTAIRQFLTRFSADDCCRFLTHAAETDRIIKGIAPGGVWDHLQLFCLRMV